MRRSLSVAVVAALTACGSAPPPPPAPAPVTAASSAPSPVKPPAEDDSSEFAPTPYTAEQIRKATSVGRTYEFHTEVTGAPPRRLVITFTKVSDTEAETRNALLDEKGVEITPPKISVATWDELRRHAEFPGGATVIANERITVPAGTYDCVRYTVTEPSGEVSKFYFAKTMPGAPILFMTDKAGARIMTTTLTRYVKGS